MSGPWLLIALRRAQGHTTPEAEPVLVEHDGTTVTLTLDDGAAIVLDERELLASLDQAA